MTERRPCRIHPNVEHLQQAVCVYDGTPHDPDHHHRHCPTWRCVEGQQT